MNKLDASAYRHAFYTTFNEVKKKYPNFGVGKMLKEIVADWLDTQLQGLPGATGEKEAKLIV